jgi:hypothetical protein
MQSLLLWRSQPNARGHPPIVNSPKIRSSGVINIRMTITGDDLKMLKDIAA